MRFALVDSGLGVLPAAMHLRRLCPWAELVLSMDPEGMPWGQRNPEDIAERALACARATLEYEPDVLVLACNTASVRALDVLRRELEPDLPVVGTVPAIKPAAAVGGAIAIWATVATTGSPYQRDLIRQFARGVKVTEIACPGLAGAIEAADQDAIDAAVGAAAFLTPPDVRSVVLGCTQYELAMDRIRGALPRIRLHGSAAAVAAQALRRRAARPAGQADAAGGQRHAAPPAAAGQTGQRHAAPPAAAGQTGQRHAAPTAAAGQTGERPAAGYGTAAPVGHRNGALVAPAGPSGRPDAASPVPGVRTVPSTSPASAAASAAPASAQSSAAPAAAASSAAAAGDGRRRAEGGPPTVWVLLSGESGELPGAALHYAEGRLLAGLRLPSPAA